MYDSLSDIISDIEVLHSTLSTGRDFDVSDAKRETLMLRTVRPLRKVKLEIHGMLKDEAHFIREKVLLCAAVAP